MPRKGQFISRPQFLIPTPEACYWMGVLLADGSMAERDLRLGVCDRDLADAFSAWSGAKGPKVAQYTTAGNPWYVVAVSAGEVRQLRDDGVLPLRKTRNPPTFDALNRWIQTDDPYLWRCLIVGLIDGDGSVQPGYVRLHSNVLWKDLLCTIYDHAKLTYYTSLYGRSDPRAKLLKLEVSIGDRASRRHLADVANSLPFCLRRKWDVVTEATMGEGPEERTARLRPEIERLLSEGVGVSQIVRQLNVSYTTVNYVRIPGYTDYLRNRRQQLEESKAAGTYFSPSERLESIRPQVLALRATGMARDKVAAKLGITTHQVRAISPSLPGRRNKTPASLTNG